MLVEEQSYWKEELPFYIDLKKLIFSLQANVRSITPWDSDEYNMEFDRDYNYTELIKPNDRTQFIAEFRSKLKRIEKEIFTIREVRLQGKSPNLQTLGQEQKDLLVYFTEFKKENRGRFRASS